MSIKRTIELEGEDLKTYDWLRKNWDMWKKAKDMANPSRLVVHFNANGECNHKEFHEFGAVTLDKKFE